jgi:hypothetical protein
MAIPWLIVLQNIPWREVITTAPKVADEAKKLWNTLSRQKPTTDASAQKEVVVNATVLSAEDRDLALLHAKLSNLEALTTDLHTQMLASSKLIKALADQNTQLVNHIEKNRNRLRWHAIAILLFGLVAIASLVMILGKPL